MKSRTSRYSRGTSRIRRRPLLRSRRSHCPSPVPTYPPLTKEKKHLQPLTPATLDTMVSSDRQDVDLSVSAQLGTLKDDARANGCSVASEYVDETESGRVADRHRLGEMIEQGTKPNATFEVTLVWDLSRFIRKREHALAIEAMLIDDGNRPSNVCGPAAPDVVLPHQQLGRLSALTESCLPPGSLAWHPEVKLPVYQGESDAAGCRYANLWTATRAPRAAPWTPLIRVLLPVGRRRPAVPRGRLSPA